MKKVLATTAVMALTAAASAGTSVSTVEISNTGPFGELVGGAYTLGTFATFSDSFGFSFDVTTVSIPGLDVALAFDFTNFAYSDFAGEISSVGIAGISPDVVPGSTTILGMDQATNIGFNEAETASSVSGDWFVDDALIFDPAGGGAVTVFVGFNVVPAPGAVAGFGLLGLVATRRRR